MDPITVKKRALEREELLQRIEDQATRVRREVDALLAQIKESRKGPQNGAAT